MNRILIGSTRPENKDSKTFFVEFEGANETLTILRSDYFLNIKIEVPEEINNSQIRFLMHIGRLLSLKGEIEVKGSKQSVGKVKAILKNLGLFNVTETEEQVVYSKSLSQAKVENKTESKLSIGFKNLTEEQEQIDEDELLKNENIKITKTSTGGCADKPRACANCNCGRKKDEPLPSKQELVQSVNEGNPVSGCGKCYLGDSFRCATCPYAGLPAFKPGDKLRLDDNSKVVVQTGGATVQNGKVKIQL